MAISNMLTMEEVLNNYQYQVAVRLLKNRFPFIVDVKPSPDINQYNLIFIDLYVDLSKFLKQTQTTPAPWILYYLSKNEPYEAPFTTMLTREKIDVDAKDIDNILDKIHDSPAIPPTMKLPKNRKLRVGSFIVDPKYNSFEELNKLSTSSTGEGV
jgi:hypothetical protein